MIELLLYIALTLLVLLLAAIIVLLVRKTTLDPTVIQAALQPLRESLERTDRSVREEITRNREDTSTNFRETRIELGNLVQGLANAIGSQVATALQSIENRLERSRTSNEEQIKGLSDSVTSRLEQMRADLQTIGKSQREENAAGLKAFGDSIVTIQGEQGRTQTNELTRFGEQITKLTEANEAKLEAVRSTVDERLKQIQAEGIQNAQNQREESTMALKGFRETLVASLSELGRTQITQLNSFDETLTKLSEGNEKQLGAVRATLEERLTAMQVEASTSSKEMRAETTQALTTFNETVLKSLTGASDRQKEQTDKLVESSQLKADALKLAVEDKLRVLQEDNTKQLDLMRLTVDEKLQGTLEKRLGESFKQVSERLEAVSRGLGEMQSLATGVGDLKRVLTNVKARGTWGEVQLGALLEQVMTREQYATNVDCAGTNERVEYAVRLPGKSEDRSEVVWLPIDSKFPIEDYQRLNEAQERADADAVEAAAKQLELRIRACANDISKKYLCPPKTTDFGILFLPTEGLFAEVVRREGLTDYVQRESHVMIAGPTTLYAVLNSLQMGFKTLAIQRRSGEVWQLLSAVKTEFGKYGDVLKKVQKKLTEASNTIEDASTRTRVIDRKLRSVETLEAGESTRLLGLNEDELVEEGAEPS